MAQALLVNIDLDIGARILRNLDEAGMQISVACWAHLDRYSDWRLIFASRRFDALGLPEAYGRLNDAMDAAGIPIQQQPIVMIYEMTDPFIRDIRRYFRKSKYVEGSRIDSQLFGDRWANDGYVYRVR